MSTNTTLVISLPEWLRNACEVLSLMSGAPIAEAFREIIYGLSGLTEAELWSLDEPPPAGKYVELAIVLEWEYVDRLTEVARVSKMDISSIFRRILYNFLETKKVTRGN